MLMNMNMHT